METRENSYACCGGSGKHKKFFIILILLVFLAIAALSVAIIGWKMHEGIARNNSIYGGNFGRGQMMNNRGNYIMPSIAPGIENKFVLPGDALKSGELAIVVNNLDAAKQAVSDIAVKGDGEIYETFIAYTSNNVKNGSIVVQVPAEKFETAFGELKKVGSQVVQEKTTKIAPINYYPVPMTAEEKPVASDSVESDAPAAITLESEDAKAEIATFPTSAQQVQDKGYIKVVFVDYGAIVNNRKTTEQQGAAGNILGIGDPAKQDMRNNLLVIVGVKLIFIVAILGLLFAIFKKIFHRIKRRKENKKVVHVVRQMPKARTRVVRIAKRK